jgi:hypothetical protein
MAPFSTDFNLKLLWKPQREALQKVQEYLEAFEQNKTSGSCLVNMPTGTGKTAIIAILSRNVPELGHVLVLSPRVALREQLYREIKNRFYSKLEYDISSNQKTIVKLGTTFPDLKSRRVPPTVIVTTIQKLQSLANIDRDAFKLFWSQLSLVLIDEGHCEPAPTWSRLVRAIEKPRVIFTATPYRNDLKVFDIDYKYTSIYGFNNAVADGFIRSVEIIEQDPPRSPNHFVGQVVKFYYSKLKPNMIPEDRRPRVIIRCDSKETIRQISTALKRMKQSFVAIHEEFVKDDHRPFEYDFVPDPNETSATFWIHQFKLVEGIDDPRFRVLAMYEPLRNARSLVQQVGRIVRNPEQTPRSVAYFLDHSGGKQKELWVEYLAYDLLVQEKRGEVLEFGNTLMKKWRDAHPQVVYFDQRFRTPFDLRSAHLDEELRLPFSTNVYRRLKEFSLAECQDWVQQTLEKRDCPFHISSADDTWFVCMYFAIRNSPLLRTTYFVETRLGAIIVLAAEDYVYFFDSGGQLPIDFESLSEPVPVAVLRKLFQRNAKSYLTSVSLTNSSLGSTVIRARSVTASDIGKTTPLFDERSFACTTATGYTLSMNDEQEPEEVRRYIGFANGRITDTTGQKADLTEYLTWILNVDNILNTRGKPIDVLERYARESKPPNDPTPKSVLLDLKDAQDHFLTNAVEGVDADKMMLIQDVCSEVTNGVFKVAANGVECTASISYSLGGRYRIESPELDALYYSQHNDNDKSIIHFLNRTQSFRVIPSSPGFFYTSNQFYRPAISFGPGFNDDLGLFKTLIGIKRLGEITDEKGKKTLSRHSGWDPQSLFGLIDNAGSGTEMEDHFRKPDLLVCDDMSAESADFIFVNLPLEGRVGRVVFVHAKAEPHRRLYSASGLMVVCGQAVKNLKFLSVFDESRPDKAHKWHSDPWKSDGMLVRDRIRRGPRDEHLWNTIKTHIRDQYFDREVWLILGNLFSASEFKQALRIDPPKTEAVQAAYLLLSTRSEVAAIGAKMRVFCSP